MAKDNFRLLVSTTPLWHQGAAAYPLPVPIKTVYMVMGKNGPRWHTVLNTADDIYTARQTMDAANASGHFERLVIATGKSINRNDAAQWTTVECALPAPRFQQLLNQLESRTANLNPQQKLDRIPGAILLGKKQSQKFLLTLALVLACAAQSVTALLCVAICAMADTIFLNNSYPLSVAQTGRLNRFRNWAFATLNGCFLLVLLLS